MPTNGNPSPTNGHCAPQVGDSLPSLTVAICRGRPACDCEAIAQEVMAAGQDSSGTVIRRLCREDWAHVTRGVHLGDGPSARPQRAKRGRP